jgi:hypothetical protein
VCPLTAGRSIAWPDRRHAEPPAPGFPSSSCRVLPQGVAQTRKCRDVLFLLLFLGFWVGMFIVCGVAFKKGAQRNLARPLPAGPRAARGADRPPERPGAARARLPAPALAARRPGAPAGQRQPACHRRMPRPACAAGDATRLIYGMDSYGFQCGAINTYKNTTIDLREYPNKYYLNALELLSLSNIPYAKSICVKECPKAESVCNSSSLPCLKTQQYM